MKLQRTGTGKYLLILSLLFLIFSCRAMQVQAAALNLTQIGELFEQTIAQGEETVTFTASAEYTQDQLQEEIHAAALRAGRLYTGGSSYRKWTDGVSAQYTYMLPKSSFLQVTVLKNTKEAYRAALQALKNSDYETRFYSKKSYYAAFRRMLRQHPEYNYDTVIWHNTNGTYGYRQSSELTEAQQETKWKAADRKADAVVRNMLTAKMTDTQKARTIHDYLLKNCSYDYSLTRTDGYEDSFTAYGALVKKKAVCQGYTAAFNLIARKAGLSSMAVCGTAGGVKHTWNYVKLGNRYRYIDCTWDDTAGSGKKLCYDYFAVTEPVIAKNHRWVKKDYTSGYLKY